MNEKKIQIFLKVFLKHKNKYALIRKFNPISKEKIIITQLLYNIKKIRQFIFSLVYKKKLNKRKEREEDQCY